MLPLGMFSGDNHSVPFEHLKDGFACSSGEFSVLPI